MAAIFIFFCSYLNYPFLPRSQSQNSKEYLTLNEARRANLNVNKGILKWKPFWNKVYGSWDAYLASPADFAGEDDIITNLAKSLGSRSSNALPNL